MILGFYAFLVAKIEKLFTISIIQMKFVYSKI